MADHPPVEGTASIPTNARSKQLRACLLCSIIQTPADFKRFGCPNCEEVLQLKGYPERILTCTSTQFDGVVAVIDPENSWASRWQRTSKYVRGMYAARVMGRIPLEMEDELASQGFAYRSRDETGE